MATLRMPRRRMGNENPETGTTFDPKATSTIAAKPLRRSARVSTGATTGALATKTTNKAADARRGNLQAKDDVKKPTATTSRRVAQPVTLETAGRVIKPLRKTPATTVKTASEPKPSLSATKKLAGTKRPARMVVAEDEVLHTVLEGESEEEEEADVRKKRARTEEPAKDYGWEDLDQGDEEDPLMVTEYVNEVYQYLKELELQTLTEPNYMAAQEEITWRMRGILVDWLIEVHSKFRLLPETIFIAVNIIDRFCAIRPISVVKYQLMGVTALFIAAKYEEICCPSIQNFLFMTDGGFTDEELLKAEKYVLQIIGWDLSYPNPINFLRRISKADDYDMQSRTVAKYFMELTCVDRWFLGTPPSLIAAAATWMSRKVLNRGPWDANLVHYSTYSQEEILPTAQKMLDYVVRSIHLGEPQHPSFHKKYAARKYFKASEAVRDWAREHYLQGEAAESVLRSYAAQAPDYQPSNYRGISSSPRPDMMICRLEELGPESDEDE